MLVSYMVHVQYVKPRWLAKIDNTNNSFKPYSDQLNLMGPT